MKTAPTMRFCAALLLVAMSLPGVSQSRSALSEDIIAAHWHPATAAEARLRTMAAAAWLEDGPAGIENWRSAVNAHALMLAPTQEEVRWQWTPLADGLFAWLVQARERNLARPDAALPEPGLNRIEPLTRQDAASGRVGRMARVAGREAPSVWAGVRRHLAAGGLDADAEINAFWEPLLANVDHASDEIRQQWAVHASAQARRVLDIAGSDRAGERAEKISRLLLEQAKLEWREERELSALWLLIEGLMRLAHADNPDATGRAYSEWFGALEDDQRRDLRRIDVDLPLILALLEDAAGYLGGEPASVAAALDELADAYARLALFAPDMGFYLDQPVREEIRSVVAACNPDPLVVGPLPREVFERCAQRLIDVLDHGLATDELIGGAQGPFAPEFLRRELGLVSWQRAAYLDGHLGWMLDAPCEPPDWVNVLDWSLIVEHLARWVPQRPVFFVSTRWQEAIESLRERSMDRARIHADWIDCLTGQGSERRDPVLRLVEWHERGLREIDSLLDEAREQFYQNMVRPGGNIDLDGPPDQVTGYRPEGIMVRACPESDACGVRAELPVSRALLGLFPNAYLLADQIGMGDITLCYDEVRWVDRASSPARKRDKRVANYHGRLSFDLVGVFDAPDETETVFRHRLVASERSHYLFAADEPEVLGLECPHELIGSSVASQMPDERPGLVPNRLTYFVSAPTTPEARLVANWDRGAEWRDWFITGNRVEVLEPADGQALEAAVQARLAALSAQRERQLSAPLTGPVRAETGDPLTQAMARVADSTAMLRRLMEIHYPRVIRHHEPVRALIAGESGLLTRDRVRALREAGVPMMRVPAMGMDRLQSLRETWLELPVSLRELGQPAPEIDYGFERLEQLIRISRYEHERASVQQEAQ